MPSYARRKYYKNEQARRDSSKERKQVAYLNQNMKNYEVNKEYELLDFLFSIFRDQSKNNVKMLLSKRYVAVNGLCVTQFNYSLVRGDTVQISKIPLDKAPIKKEVKEKLNLDIIYEDDEFIVINKPSGLLTIESDTEKVSTAYKLVLSYMQQKDKNARCFQTHRLDKDTSGVLLFVKDHDLNEMMKKMWNKIVKVRKYVAIVEGKMEKKEDTITTYLLKDENNLMHTSTDKTHGEKAITKYIVKKENAKYSLLDVYIETGKKNQIRVTLDSIGHPIIGDEKYGNASNPINRLGLHAEMIEFVHPKTGDRYTFKALVPSEFRKVFR